MRGRKPKPSYLAVLDGGASHSRESREDEPIIEAKLLDPPAHFNGEQVKVWRDALVNVPVGMLTQLDSSIFEGWCMAYCRHRSMQQMADQFPMGFKDKKGNAKVNPFLAEGRRQALVMRAFASDLGFSPTTRARVKISKPAKGQGPDTFAKLKQLDE